jgi:hypothetical protein
MNKLFHFRVKLMQEKREKKKKIPSNKRRMIMNDIKRERKTLNLYRNLVLKEKSIDF